MIGLNPVKLYPQCVRTIATCIFIKLNYLHQFNMSFSHIEVPHKSLPYHQLHAQRNRRQLRRWETDAQGPESAILKLRLTWETFSSWETGGETGGIPRHSYQSSPPMSSIPNNSQHITRQIRTDHVNEKYTTSYNSTSDLGWALLPIFDLLRIVARHFKRGQKLALHWHSTEQKEIAVTQAHLLPAHLTQHRNPGWGWYHTADLGIFLLKTSGTPPPPAPPQKVTKLITGLL